MYNSGKIIIGLIIFVLIVSLPVTYNMIASSNTKAPELEIPLEAGKQCVRNTDYMRTSHMELINQWRDEVVRQGDRFTAGPDGGVIEKSLSNTCLGCHSNKENFCDRCHNYMAVTPYCWSCHTSVDEVEKKPTVFGPDQKEEY